MENIIEVWQQLHSPSFTRAAMRRNINSNNRNARYPVSDERKIVSRHVAKLRAIAHKAGNDGSASVLEYLMFLRREVRVSYANRIEPALAYVQEQFSTLAWQPIVLRDFIDGEFNWQTEMTMDYLHNLHVSTVDPAQIAYYPTLRHMREQREVRTKLGRYLAAYQTELGLTDAQIKVAAERYAAQTRARAGWQVKFVAHNDPDGWVDVYTRGPSSCMRGETAVRVYAHEHSVLRLAYVETMDGEIIARCIVRDDEEKGWLRVYPEPDNKAEGRFLLDYLKANGYAERTHLNGALLQCIEGDYGGYVCPYIDYGSGGDQSVSVVYRHGAHYLECGGGDIEAIQTNGYTAAEGRTCDECDETFHEDELAYVESVEQEVCECCLNRHYRYAIGRNGYREWHPNGDVVECQSNNEYYVTEYTSDNDVYLCEFTDDYYKLDDLCSTMQGMINSDDAVALDHEDSDGNNYAHPNYVTTLSDGTTCHDDDAERLEAELAEEAA